MKENPAHEHHLLAGYAYEEAGDIGTFEIFQKDLKKFEKSIDRKLMR